MNRPAGKTMSRAARRLVLLEARGARPRVMRRQVTRTQRRIDDYEKRMKAWFKATGRPDPKWHEPPRGWRV
jgi:hypothetical protein